METGKISNNFKFIFKGVGISLIATVILLLIYSLLLTYTNMMENTIQPVIITITAICILFGSSIGNSKIQKNGVLNGGIIGGLYVLILYLISSIWNWKFAVNIQGIAMICIGILFGIIGGIIGVNRK